MRKTLSRTVIRRHHRSGTRVARPLRVFQLAGAVLLVTGIVSAMALSGRAGAGTGPGSSGNTITNAAQAQQPFTPNAPFDSGQPIDVVIPPNSVLTPGSQIFVLECAAPNGVNPTSTASCDGNTGYAGGTITVNSDGSIDVINSSTNSGLPYVIYALPDTIKLGESATGTPKCGLGAANECVLYIGQGGGSDTGFSQPHFFSQAFQVHPDPTDSGSLNPGDGSPAQSTTVSPTLSTETPSTQQATADGLDPATVTVTLNDSNSAPVQGKTVSLSDGAGHATVVPASTGSNVTDANGQATFTVTDSTAETVTLTATDSTDSVTVTQTAQAAFAAPTVNQSKSGVTASPAQVPNDGSTASTLTVKLLDVSVHGSPAPLAGRTISIAPGSGSSVVAPASSGSNVTDSTGTATFKVTDTVNEAVTYKATDTTDSVTLTQTAAVQFGAAAPVSATKSTVVANPTSPTIGTGGTNGTMVTVTLLASDGTTPIPAKTVTLTATSTSGHTAINGNSGTTGTGTSNASGQVMFFVTDTTPETVTFSAADTTDTVNLVATATATFSNPPPPTVSPDQSTIGVSCGNIVADGFTDCAVTVKIVDTTGTAMAGVTVTLATSPNATTTVDPIQGSSGVPAGTTDSQGDTQWNVRDTTAETVTLTATAGGVTLSAHPTITYIAGSADANQSTVTASPTSVPADGTSASTVTVTLTDFFGNVVQGKTVILKALSGSSTIAPASSGSDTTNAQGVATFSVKDATNEAVTYTATDSTDGLVLSALASVTFGNAPTVVPTQGDSGVTTNASKVVADGKTPALITVTLRDSNGLPVSGKTVSLAASGGSSVISAAPAATGSIATAQSRLAAAPHVAHASTTVTTNSNGVAAFDATDTVVESVTYTASDTTDSMSGWTVAVAFTAAPATTTTTTAPTTATTSPPAPASSSSAGSGDSGSGGTGSGASGSGDSSSSTGATGPNLAFTGASPALPWLFGVGGLFLIVGTVGRRILAARRRVP